MSEIKSQEQWAQWLHLEHIKEFGWLAGDDISDFVTAEQCGNCQRWGRYAAAVQRESVLREAAEHRGDAFDPNEVIHALPMPGDGGVAPCCGKTPFELPRTDRMTATDSLVTCGRLP